MNTPDLPPHVDPRHIVPLGTCWFCLHPVTGEPNFLFIHRMWPLVPADVLATVPEFYDEFYDERGGRASARWHWLPFMIETQAHAECKFLNDHAIPMPDSPDELEFDWEVAARPEWPYDDDGAEAEDDDDLR